MSAAPERLRVWNVPRFEGEPIRVFVMARCEHPHIEVHDRGALLWLSEKQAAELASGLDHAREILQRQLRGATRGAPAPSTEAPQARCEYLKDYSGFPRERCNRPQGHRGPHHYVKDDGSIVASSDEAWLAGFDSQEADAR